MVKKLSYITFVALWMLLVNFSGHARPAESKPLNETSDFWHLLPVQQQKESTLANNSGSLEGYNYWTNLTYERGYSIHVADVNQDGWDDVIFSTEYRLRIWVQNPSCHALEEWLDLPTDLLIFDIDAADLNQDGSLEIIVIGMPTYDFAEGQGYVQIFIPSPIGFIPSEELYPIGIGPRKVEVADVSGDSRLDILVSSSDVLDVLVQQSDGNFILNVINDPKKESWEYPNSVASADFNGDGLNDVAVQVGNRPSSVIVYYQDALGELDPGIDLPWPSFPYAMTIMGNSMIAGDITGDDRADLMVMTSYNSPYANIVVYEQLPAGGFAVPSVTSTYQLPISPNLGDMDNDGRLDLVLMNGGYGTFTVHYQLPDGGLGGEIHRPAGDVQQFYPYQDLASIGDLTGDGKLDIAYLSVNYGLVIVAQGTRPFCPSDGPEHARKPVFLVGTIGPLSVRRMVSADINEDALDDFLTFSNDPDDPYVPVIYPILQSPPGFFHLGDPIQLNGIFDPNSLSVGDLNGDGRIDIALSDYSKAAVLYHGSSGVFLPPVILNVNDSPQQVYIADWNDDGRDDLAVIAEGGITVFAQQSDGNLGGPVINNPGEIGTTFLGDDIDWDQDGKLDLALWWTGYSFVKPLRVFLQQMGGGFELLPPVRASVPKTVVAGDLNSDNRPDLAISHYANEPEARLELFYQTDDGMISDRKILSGPDYNTPDDIAISDLNFDGLNDLLVLNTAGYGISVFTQNKAHTFDPPVFYAWKLWNHINSHSIAQVDTDGDGKEDVFAHASGDNYVLFIKPIKLYETYLPVVGR